VLGSKYDHHMFMNVNNKNAAYTQLFLPHPASPRLAAADGRCGTCGPALAANASDIPAPDPLPLMCGKGGCALVTGIGATGRECCRVSALTCLFCRCRLRRPISPNRPPIAAGSVRHILQAHHRLMISSFRLPTICAHPRLEGPRCA
jgi:hypothetical protein